jgi:hypothetical protein
MVGEVGDHGFFVGPIVRRWIERPDRTEYSEEEYLLVSRDGRTARPIIRTEGPAYVVLTFADGRSRPAGHPFMPVRRARWCRPSASLPPTLAWYTINAYRLDGTREQTISRDLPPREAAQVDLGA